METHLAFFATGAHTRTNGTVDAIGCGTYEISCPALPAALDLLLVLAIRLSHSDPLEGVLTVEFACESRPISPVMEMPVRFDPLPPGSALHVRAFVFDFKGYAFEEEGLHEVKVNFNEVHLASLPLVVSRHTKRVEADSDPVVSLPPGWAPRTEPTRWSAYKESTP